MTTRIFDFPAEWYGLVIAPQKFRPRSMTQAFNRTWKGGQNVSGPVSKVWLADITLAPSPPMSGPSAQSLGQDIQAFIDRLDGRANVLRMPDTTRLMPWYDRNLVASTATWSDGSTFSDGSRFANGYLPPEVFAYAAAARGANYVVLGGFPTSTANVLRKGDLLEVKPNGIPAEFPHLYEAMQHGSSDSSGRVGIEITPKLRAGIAAGDVVSLRNAAGLFRLTSDDQGETQVGADLTGNVSFSLVEALDLVP